MSICLISAATATDFESRIDAEADSAQKYAAISHLGVLALAAALEKSGHVPLIINLNRCYYDYLKAGRLGVDEFASYAAEIISINEADVYGFSSVCSSYPLTIRIAKRLRGLRPDCKLLFGGPQASVVDLRTLSAFPFVDFILRGEADETLPVLINEVFGNQQFASVPGLSYRSPFGPTRNGNAPLIEDLDILPLPAYHLTGDLNHVTAAPLELGRGCPFACTFCSTNDFFRRRFRVKSPQRMLADMRAISSAYGIRTFDLAHDMFTVDRRRVVAFCECMRDSQENFEWSCSARTDCVDEELLELMADSGCRGIFFGIETGSRRMQRIIDKDLDIEEAKRIIAITDRLGIETDVSLITGFPEENPDDLNETVAVYMYSLSHVGSTPQLNLLAPLPDTPIHRKYRDQLTLEELCSDMGHQGRLQNSADRQLIADYPDIFPNFYLLPVPYLNRDYLLELREFFVTASAPLRWLLVALHWSNGNILDIFSGWRRNRLEKRPELRGLLLREYYVLAESRRDFIAFVRQHCPDARSVAVDCLLSCYEVLEDAIRRQPEQRLCTRTAEPDPEDLPIRSPFVCVFELHHDVQGVINSLKAGVYPTVVDGRRRYFRTRKRSSGEIQVIETTALIAAALKLCDGKHTVSAFVDEMAHRCEAPPELQKLAAECLLETLERQQLVRIYSSEAKPATSRPEKLVCAAVV